MSVQTKYIIVLRWQPAITIVAELVGRHPAVRATPLACGVTLTSGSMSAQIHLVNRHAMISTLVDGICPFNSCGSQQYRAKVLEKKV